MTIKPCVKCGACDRKPSGDCRPCGIRASIASHKKNPEGAKASNARYREANRDKRRAGFKAWASKNPARQAERTKQWLDAHPGMDKFYAAVRTVTQSDKTNAKTMRRHASKLCATPLWANAFFIGEAYHLAKLRENVCGGRWNVDHIVPLRSKYVCGLHVEHNLQVIPESVNRAKSNRWWPEQWSN